MENLDCLMLDRNKIKKHKSQIDVPQGLFLFY